MPAEVKSTGNVAVLDAARQFFQTFKTSGLILVAVSGGSDSKGLLLALNEAIPAASGFSLAACTVDHALRPESAGEAQVVAQLCARLGIRHITRRWEDDKPATGLQAAARNARYGLLASVARETGALCVVTGHSCNDQIETIAMRSARSDQASAGLSGMADAVLYGCEIWVLRPFLSIDRAGIRNYLTARSEVWLDDPSNESNRFERVRVRRKLAETPVTQQSMDPRHSEREVTAAHAAAFLAVNATVHSGLVARIDPVPVMGEDGQGALIGILSLAACLGGRRYLPGRETKARIIRFVDGGADGRLTAGRVVFDRRRSGLYLYREARDLPVLSLAAGEEGLWDDRYRISNPGERPVTISAAMDLKRVAGLIAAGVPEGVARRAAKACPSISGANPEFEPASPAGKGFCLSPWDTFLPRFDLILANQCAVLFGREHYKSLPVHHVFAEKIEF